MIYTLTLNPSLDYVLDVNEIKIGKTNRSREEYVTFGGKGINVSVVLKRLGISSTCLGFAAGFTGDELERMLKNEGIRADFVRLEKGNTRINVKLRGQEITEVNADGPEISDTDLQKLFEKLSKISDGDTLVIAGSVPSCLDGDVYCEIMKSLSAKNVRFVVDTNGSLLRNALGYKPFLVKPNLDELSELAGRKLETETEIVSAAKQLWQMGAQNVLVSMGENGAILVTDDGRVYSCPAFRIVPKSTVGAGDSMLAGFLSGLDRGYEYALRLANACGAASAESMTLADKNRISELLGE